MTKDETDLLAAEYVLGSLEPEAREAFARDLDGDSELQEMVAAWEARLAPLAGAGSPVAPPAGLWEKIADRLPGNGAERPTTRTIREGDGSWITITPGIEIKLLHEDRADGMRSFLVRCGPGARLASHIHRRVEECFVVSGEVEFGDVRLKAGDYHLSEAGSVHAESYSRDGCLLFIRGAITEFAA